MAISRAMASPRPVPPELPEHARSCSRRVNLSKMLALASTGMPGPSSAMVMTASVPWMVSPISPWPSWDWVVLASAVPLPALPTPHRRPQQSRPRQHPTPPHPLTPTRSSQGDQSTPDVPGAVDAAEPAGTETKDTTGTPNARDTPDATGVADTADATDAADASTEKAGSKTADGTETGASDGNDGGHADPWAPTSTMWEVPTRSNPPKQSPQKGPATGRPLLRAPGAVRLVSPTRTDTQSPARS